MIEKGLHLHSACLLAKRSQNNAKQFTKDIMMPKMNGFEFYHEIRKNDIKAKVCFITAFPV
jgi:CheY-like chemotaxis protein